MKIEQCTDGTWRVLDPDGAVIAAGVTNATAWAIVDGYDDEAIEDQATHLRVVAAFQWALRQRYGGVTVRFIALR
jgi:hypothetical protein